MERIGLLLGFIHILLTLKINVREYRRGNQEYTIQRNWQHWVHKAQYEDKKIAQYSSQTVYSQLRTLIVLTEKNGNNQVRLAAKIKIQAEHIYPSLNNKGKP